MMMNEALTNSTDDANERSIVGRKGKPTSMMSLC